MNYRNTTSALSTAPLCATSQLLPVPSGILRPHECFSSSPSPPTSLTASANQRQVQSFVYVICNIQPPTWSASLGCWDATVLVEVEHARGTIAVLKVITRNGYRARVSGIETADNGFAAVRSSLAVRHPFNCWGPYPTGRTREQDGA